MALQQPQFTHTFTRDTCTHCDDDFEDDPDDDDYGAGMNHSMTFIPFLVLECVSCPRFYKF